MDLQYWNRKKYCPHSKHFLFIVWNHRTRTSIKKNLKVRKIGKIKTSSLSQNFGVLIKKIVVLEDSFNKTSLRFDDYIVSTEMLFKKSSCFLWSIYISCLNKVKGIHFSSPELKLAIKLQHWSRHKISSICRVSYLLF